MGNKFLTVFAVFDNKTQTILKNLQDEALKLGCEGTQTMDIPFHISLGSYPIGNEIELSHKIKQVCSSIKKFPVRLEKVNNFGNKVLFIEPKLNEELLFLRQNFNNDYPNSFPWHPHATIFQANEAQVIAAQRVLEQNFHPFDAEIVGLQMGEFFPTKMIEKSELRK